MLIGERIREVARESGVSFNRIAARLGEDLSGRNFRLILAGKTRNPSIRSVAAIARALGVSVDCLTLGVEGIAQPGARGVGERSLDLPSAVLWPDLLARLEESGVSLEQLVHLLGQARDAGVSLEDVVAAVIGEPD